MPIRIQRMTNIFRYPVKIQTLAFIFSILLTASKMYMACVAQDLNKADFIAAVSEIKEYFFFMKLRSIFFMKLRSISLL